MYEARDKKGVQEIGFKIADYYYNTFSYRTSLAYCMNVYELCGEETERWFLNTIGMIFLHTGEVTKALTFFTLALKSFGELYETVKKGIPLKEIDSNPEDLENLGTTLNNISQIYSARGDYTEAIKILEEVADIFKTLGDIPHLAIVLWNIGVNYCDDLHDREKGMGYLLQARELFTRCKLDHKVNKIDNFIAGLDGKDT